MLHRHIQPNSWSPTAIDDVIERGSLADWYALRAAALADERVMARIEHIARRRAEDPYAQRFHFWKRYAESRRAVA